MIRIVMSLFLTVVAFSWATPQVQAAAATALPVEALARSAALIVDGTVTGLSSQWNSDRTQIHTYVRISVYRVLKGDYVQDELVLRLLGGVLSQEDIGMDVVGAPALAEGDHVVFFLKKNWSAPLPFVGDVQGAFIVQPDGRVENPVGLAFPQAELESRVTAVVQRELRLGVKSEYLITPDPGIARAVAAKAAGR